MRVMFDPARLAEAMQLITKVANARGGSVIPVLGAVHIEATADGVILTGNNLETWIRVAVDADVEAPGICVVQTERLTSITRAAPPGSQLLLNAEMPRAQVQIGRGRYQLAMIEAGEFPTPNADEHSVGWKAEAGNFCSALRRTAAFASTDTARNYICGVYLNFEDDHPHYVATNGHYMLHVTGEILSACGDVSGQMPDEGIIIDRAGALVLQDIVGRTGVLDIAVAGGKVIVQTEDAMRTIAIPLIDGTYPTWRRMFPSGKAPVASVDARLASEMISRVGTFRSKRKNGVSLHIEQDRMIASVTDDETGEQAIDEVPVAFASAAANTGLNIKYLSDLLALADSGTMEISHIQQDEPVKFTQDDGDWEAVCSPMRV